MASKSRRNKTKFKFTKELLFLILFLLAVGGATIALAIPSRAETTLKNYNAKITEYNTTNSKSYDLLVEDNVYDETDFEGLSKKITSSNEYTYVLYGSFTQEEFVSNIAGFNTMAKEYDIKKIYIVFSTWVEESDVDSIEFKNEQKKIESYFTVDTSKNVNNFVITKYPSLLAFKDGKLVYNSQTYADSSEYNWNTLAHAMFTLDK